MLLHLCGIVLLHVPMDHYPAQICTMTHAHQACSVWMAIVSVEFIPTIPLPVMVQVPLL